VRRIGIDENGLGAQLGPLVVTAVEAEVNEAGDQLFQRKLPKSLRKDLDDSKALVSCHDIALGEAWARVSLEKTLGKTARCPKDVASQLLLPTEKVLRKECPKTSEAQCWTSHGETFVAETDLLARLKGHLGTLERKGLRLTSVRSEVLCTSKLSRLRRSGVHRFAADLSAMERLLLSLEDPANPFVAVCGKVGGIGRYGEFFSELSDRLYSTLKEGRAESAYHFPKLGEIRFVRDADAKDPLVMLASLVGKYMRELFMGRINRYYARLDSTSEAPTPSGYHDPVTRRFIEQTHGHRRRLEIAQDCFIRSREEVPRKAPDKAPTRTKKKAGSSAQGQLF
jgi:ribonuclease HII